MISASQSPANNQTISAHTRRLRHREERPFDGYHPGQRDPLREELRQTLLEVARLEEENEALRKSAEIWIRMYEGQLARANEAARLWHPDLRIFSDARITRRSSPSPLLTNDGPSGFAGLACLS